ncbi:N-acetylmuramoyl-L-alanine amidase [Actinopolymorpha alba]|uniref:peptidoglycan recognition protein family protein n=1 Tax=Actinopolymorpha alba TaxID=533267 RepID=UPI00037D8EFB|nr:peptidoglycan-binding protein [Actinopolymorpha alba]
MDLQSSGPAQSSGLVHAPGLGRRGLFKAGLGAAAVAVIGSELPTAPPAHAAPGDEFPWIVSCDDWGARPPAAPIQLSGNVTNKIIVHHMAFPNVTDYSRDQAIRLAQDCQDLHMDRNGWADTGQHFTVSRGGYVLEGRHRSLETLRVGEQQVIAAHCPGENGNAIGIESEGTYITETPPQALLDSLTRLCVTICQQYGLHSWDLFGHWDFRDTQCPGIAFYRQFPMLRRRVAARLGERGNLVPRRRWPDIWKFVGGPVVRVAQYLLNARGYQLTANGVFGADTVGAVQDWQARNGIPVDVDATLTGPTWESLVQPLGKGSTGLPVTAVQFILGRKGYAELTMSGGYDQATSKAVQDLQRLHGLPPNGDVDTSTWCVITGGIVREAFD